MKAPNELSLKYTCECCGEKFEEGALIPNEKTGKIYLCTNCFEKAVVIVMIHEEIRPALDIIKEKLKDKKEIEDNLPF